MQKRMIALLVEYQYIKIEIALNGMYSYTINPFIQPFQE